MVIMQYLCLLVIFTWTIHDTGTTVSTDKNKHRLLRVTKPVLLFSENTRKKSLLILKGNRAMRNGEWIKKLTCFHLVAVHYFKKNKTLRCSFDKQNLINFHGKQFLMVPVLFWDYFGISSQHPKKAFMQPPPAPHPQSNNYSNHTTNDSVVVRNKQRILEAKTFWSACLSLWIFLNYQHRKPII